MAKEATTITDSELTSTAITYPPWNEEGLTELLQFIQKKGTPLACFFGGNITTYFGPGTLSRNIALHEGCLELEKRGLIRRFREEIRVTDGFDTGEGIIIWEAVE